MIKNHFLKKSYLQVGDDFYGIEPVVKNNYLSIFLTPTDVGTQSVCAVVNRGDKKEVVSIGDFSLEAGFSFCLLGRCFAYKVNACKWNFCVIENGRILKFKEAFYRHFTIINSFKYYRKVIVVEGLGFDAKKAELYFKVEGDVPKIYKGAAKLDNFQEASVFGVKSKSLFECCQGIKIEKEKVV